MKPANCRNYSFGKSVSLFARALVVAGFLFCTFRADAQLGFGSGWTNPYTALDTWSFQDHTNWTSDNGYAPVSFTNLNFSYLGNGNALLVNTNLPAWLQYNVYENDGTTNLTVDQGTVMFWFAPSSWSGTNAGGIGPYDYGRLFEAGSYTPDSSYGLWSIYVDPAGANIYFSTQTNDLSSNLTTYITYPISWTTNYFHFVTLTYSATNTALYLDGVLATNGPGVTVYPGPDVLTNGFHIGSDSNGVYQAFGLFNSVATYNVPMDADTIQRIFNDEYVYYEIDPFNTAMSIASATSYPSDNSTTFDIISGIGNLIWVTNAATCVYGSTANQVWFTNITSKVVSNGTVNVTFTIEGGWDAVAYDVFANGTLAAPLTNAVWAWLGQGYHCNTYTININSADAFLILGTAQDTSGSGLTDAYENLVMHVSPSGSQSDAYGVPYAWYAEFGLSASSALLDPDQDGLLNYQEYQYGTRPTTSEGFSVWTTGNYSSIP
jgi:hypothetical protein